MRKRCVKWKGAMLTSLGELIVYLYIEIVFITTWIVNLKFSVVLQKWDKLNVSKEPDRTETTVNSAIKLFDFAEIRHEKILSAKSFRL